MTKESTSSEAAPKRKSWKYRILIGLAVFVALLLFFLVFLVNWTIAATVRNVAPRITGTPVELAKVNLNVFTGRLQLDGFKIANPKGFLHPYAFELDHFVADVDMLTLLSKKLVVEEVTVEGMLADYELGLRGTNLGIIQENVDRFSGKKDAKAKGKGASAGEPAAQAADSETEKSSRKVVIRKLQVSGLELAMGSFRLPLPGVTLNNLGDGRSMGEVISEFYTALMQSVAVEVSRKTMENFGNQSKDAGKQLLDQVKNFLQ